MSEINLRGNRFILGADKEMYWPEKKTLIISDVHLGKTKHFTNNGIQVPSLVNTNNYWRLSVLFDKYKADRVIFLGDLFHSVYNEEWDKFKDYLANYPQIEWILVEGNHDILHPQHYKDAGLDVVELLAENGLCFTHEPVDFKEGYNICGHLHPAVRMRGKAAQSLRLPCFYFSEKRGILPAFGEFTGALTIKPEKEDQVFVIAEKKVIQVN